MGTKNGNGQNGTAEVEEPTDESKKFLTADDLNGAMTNYSQRQTKAMEKFIRDAVQAAIGPLAESLAKAKAPEDEAPVPAGKANEPEWKLEMARMQKRLEQSEKAREEEKRAREQERQERMRSEEISVLTDSLRGVGVSDEVLLSASRAMLRDRLARDAAGAVIIKGQVDGMDTDIPVKEFLKGWAKSDEGKRFLPAREAKGSGAGANAGRNAPRGSQPADGLVPFGDAKRIVNEALTQLTGGPGAQQSDE